VVGTSPDAEGLPGRIYRVYRPVAKLFRDLMIARADERLGRVLDTIARTNVLVVDDFDMAPLHEQERRYFLEIGDDRYHRRSTLVTSPLPVTSWHHQMGDPMLADTILDRLVHNPNRIELSGNPFARRKAGLVGGTGRRWRMSAPRLILKHRAESSAGSGVALR